MCSRNTFDSGHVGVVYAHADRRTVVLNLVRGENGLLPLARYSLQAYLNAVKAKEGYEAGG